jgi:RNA polymerase sigma-70 factor (ECF subfamily)
VIGRATGGRLIVDTRSTSGPAETDAVRFVRLTDAQLGRAFRLSGYLLGDAAEAEEATQEAILHAWRAWPKLRDAGRFGAWFDRIVVNVCRDRIRRRHGIRLVELSDEGASAPDPFAAWLAQDTVGRALAHLPLDQRMVIVLRYWGDLSLDEIAYRLAIPLGTVKSRLHYALRALRTAIGPDDGGAPR